MAPLVKAIWVDTEQIITDGLLGTNGAGAEPNVIIYRPEIGNGPGQHVPSETPCGFSLVLSAGGGKLLD